MPFHDATGNVNLVSTDVIDSGLPFAELGPNIAAMLAQAQFGGQTSRDVARTQARASTFGASTSAAATLGAAGIGAQSRVDAQLIATNGAIAQNNAQMKTDAALAAAGDIAAYRRLLQEQQYDAQLQNNANKMEIAKLAGSGSLFDNIASRFAAAGQGPLPQAGGAFGLAGGIQQVSAPTGNAPTSIAELMSFIPQAALQSGSGTNFLQNFSLPSAPSFGGGGSTQSIGDLFGSINQSVFDAIQGTQGGLITAVDPLADPTATSSIPAQTASNFTFDITGDPVASAANTDAANAFLLANQDQFLHAGGEIKKGQSAIVGDDRQGRLTPFSELIKVTDKGVKITPLNKFRGGFADGTDHNDGLGGDKVLSDINKLPALEALRGNPSQSIFDFGFKFERPELGISELPSPFAFGKNFLTQPFDQRKDVLDFYSSQFFGEGRQEQILNLFNQSQPGFRNFPRNAFAF